MIIKKKYIENQIKEQQKKEEEEKQALQNEPVKESETNAAENNTQTEPKTDKKEEEKKPSESLDLNLSTDDIVFAPRAERREGTRRRGYRRTQDRNLVSRAQQDAMSIKEVAKNEGYKEGIAAAQKDIEEIKANFTEFYKYKDSVVEKVSQCIMDVSVEIAKKIINKEIETDKSATISMIKGVVEEINKTENKITLKVMPKDVQLVTDSLPEIFSDGSFEAKISVIPDNNIKDGGVIVETSNGIIDATIESQMEIIKQALKGKPEE